MHTVDIFSRCGFKIILPNYRKNRARISPALRDFLTQGLILKTSVYEDERLNKLPKGARKRAFTMKGVTMKTAIENPHAVIDPVCGMTVDPQASGFEATYKQSLYHFCADACRKAFEENPEKYLDAKPRGFWRRYLDRLNKATDGKPPKCCG
jgi:YHS domain-containing protein